jgi:hypothetical protein
VPNAVPKGDGLDHLKALATAGKATHLTLNTVVTGDGTQKPRTSVSLFDQGLVQVLQASVTGLEPKKSYVLALAKNPAGEGDLESLTAFKANPAGAAIVDTVGPIRQVVQHEKKSERRYLVIAEGTPEKLGKVVQVQAPSASK